MIKICLGKFSENHFHKLVFRDENERQFYGVLNFFIFLTKKEKRKKVWIYKALTHPHPQRNIKTNPPHPHDLLPYTCVTHDLHITLRFQPMTKPSSLFRLPPPPHLQRPQWNLQRGWWQDGIQGTNTLPNKLSAGSPPLPPRAQP